MDKFATVILWKMSLDRDSSHKVNVGAHYSLWLSFLRRFCQISIGVSCRDNRLQGKFRHHIGHHSFFVKCGREEAFMHYGQIKILKYYFSWSFWESCKSCWRDHYILYITSSLQLQCMLWWDWYCVQPIKFFYWIVFFKCIECVGKVNINQDGDK